jgi:hypothetical protein
MGHDPIDANEFRQQVAAEPELWHAIATAYPPKVKIQNDIFPRPHEVYNCTTCKRGHIIPETPPNKEEYVARCSWDLQLHIGPRFNDTGCRHFISKIKRPRKGYMPGVES